MFLCETMGQADYNGKSFIIKIVCVHFDVSILLASFYFILIEYCAGFICLIKCTIKALC